MLLSASGMMRHLEMLDRPARVDVYAAADTVNGIQTPSSMLIPLSDDGSSASVCNTIRTVNLVNSAALIFCSLGQGNFL